MLVKFLSFPGPKKDPNYGWNFPRKRNPGRKDGYATACGALFPPGLQARGPNRENSAPLKRIRTAPAIDPLGGRALCSSLFSTPYSLSVVLGPR